MEQPADLPKETLENLAYFDDVLLAIFKLLPMKELHKCARVCKKWNQLSTSVQQSRRSISWFMFSPQLHSHDLQTQIADKLNISSSKPKHALIFLSNALHEDHIAVPLECARTRNRRAAKLPKMPFTDFFKQLLPSSCEVFGTTADGSIGTDWDLTECLEAENAIAASGILIPELANIKLKKFSTTVSYLQERVDRWSEGGLDPEELEEMTGVTKSDQPKLITVFMCEQMSDIVLPLEPLFNHYDNVVVAGGYVDDIIHDTEEDEYAMGFAICGGDNLRVASVIVPAEVNKEAQVTVLLKKLQSTSICNGARQSIAFMFACIGRGQYHYHGKRNVEASVFHRLFPNIPLFGFFGNGEIGCDFLPDFSGPSPVYPLRQLDEDYEADFSPLHHSYTSIFVIVSLM